MRSKIFCKSALPSLFRGLGCQKAPKPAKHKLSELTAVSISCGHMDRSYAYSFGVHKKETTWFFGAECFTRNHETETAFENRALDREDADLLLEILNQRKRIAYVENYQRSNLRRVQVRDETTYSFCLTFSDGSQYEARDRQRDLEEFFYRLAEKYCVSATF